MVGKYPVLLSSMTSLSLRAVILSFIASAFLDMSRTASESFYNSPYSMWMLDDISGGDCASLLFHSPFFRFVDFHQTRTEPLTMLH